jgi:hypothetical protein
MPDAIIDKKAVGTPTAHHDAMDEKWSMIRALWGGTATMRAAGTKYLPQESKEKNELYLARLDRSFLFNAYRDSVEKIVAKPFTRAVEVKEQDRLHEQLKPIQDDADRSGTSLTTLARELMTILINHGMAHVMVDYPNLAEQPRLDEQRALDIRPAFIPVSPANLIGFQTRKDETGRTILSQARIRVLREDGWELHEYDEDDDAFVPIDGGLWVGMNRVPLVTAYVSRDGFMTASPALEDLAWLNLEHWQSSSDQRNILRFARSGLIVVTGVTEEDVEKQGGIVVGPTSRMILDPADAKVQIVEHSGSAIGAGAEDLRAIEQKMQVLGLQPFFKLTGGTTATEKMIDEGRTETEVQSWIGMAERLLEDSYALAAQWVGTDLPDDFDVNIYSEFVLSKLVARDLAALLDLRKGGDVDRETLLSEFKRRRILDESGTVQDIIDRLEAEGPNLAGIGGSVEGGFDGE